MASDHPSTHDLVRRAQTGDQAAIGDLMQRHLQLLRAFVRARAGPVLRRRESCSDLVQSVCLEVLRSLPDYEWRGEGSFRFWLHTLALHKLTNKRDYHVAERRDPARERRQPADNADNAEELAVVYRTMSTPSKHAVAREIVETMEAALDRIPEDYREVILLARVTGLSHREIAQQLGRSEGAVRMLLQRALSRLAAAMQAVEAER